MNPGSELSDLLVVDSGLQSTCGRGQLTGIDSWADSPLDLVHNPLQAVSPSARWRLVF
jgi:hypothetical protein